MYRYTVSLMRFNLKAYVKLSTTDTGGKTDLFEKEIYLYKEYSVYIQKKLAEISVTFTMTA